MTSFLCGLGGLDSLITFGGDGARACSICVSMVVSRARSTRLERWY
jgi:hypothetical protein